MPSSAALADVSSEAEVRAARGHTLRIHMDADPGRLNPLVSPSTWSRRITNGTVFESLLQFVPPEGTAPARYAPRLAKAWKVMPSQTEIRLYLEQGATFHDGKQLTSVDVQFTLDAIRDPRRGIDHLRAMLDDVFAVELITTWEVRLVLKRPSAYVLRALAEIPIMPMHVYDGSFVAGGALVGSGPWKYVSNKNGVVHLARNPRYWGDKPAIADLEFVYQPDAAIALKDAKRGDLDIIPALIPAHWPEQASAPGIAVAFRALELAPPKWRYLAFNAQQTPLDDARVRHALALLVDRRNIAKRVFDGLSRPVLWPIWPGGFVNGPEATVPDFDPAGAAKLLDAAGWADTDKDGIRDRGGKQLRLVMLGTEKPAPRDASAPAPKIARDFFIEAARRIGVVIDLHTGGESWLEKKIGEGAYAIVERSWSGMVDMDIGPLLGAKDPQRAQSPRVDRALDVLAAAWDPGERSSAAPELAAALAESWPIAGLVAEAPKGLIHKRVQGVRVWDGWLDLRALSFGPE
ncbi:MAG: ABC transporter substrate-binding protein [Kofleriaceae bacterium]|nr:ABC transporter substrate-binding protein [Kofleriaceae bacterium]